MSKWISVNERLPDNGVDVLVVTKTKKGFKNVDKGYYWEGGWVHRGTSEVTHWMPIPEMPEEVENA